MKGKPFPFAQAGQKRGQRSQAWRGGKTISKAGYVFVYIADGHPFASMRPESGSSYVGEHRLVMAEHLGRPLTHSETVHHKLECEGGTGDITDNRIENLALFATQSAHVAHHHTLRRHEGGSALVSNSETLETPSLDQVLT